MLNKLSLDRLTEWQLNGNGWIKRVKGEALGSLEMPVFNWISVCADEYLLDEDKIIHYPKSDDVKFFVIFAGEFEFLQDMWQEYPKSQIIQVEELKQEVDLFMIRMQKLLPFI